MHTKYFPFNVPKYEELSVEKLWAFVQEWPELMEYFPDLEPGKLPERFFIMGILSTLRTGEMKKLIKDARENRSISSRADEDQLVWMTTKVKDEIFDILPQKSIIYYFAYNDCSDSRKSELLDEAGC